MKSVRVLVVDDDRDVLEMAESFFKSSGVEVHCAESGEEALERTNATEFSAIITDYNMPGMNGLELAAKVRGIDPHTPIILVTGQPSRELSQLAAHTGVNTVLSKPILLDKILNLINEMVPATSS